MLRKRSRRVGSRQGLMSDFSSLPPPTPKYSRPTTSLFPSHHPFVCGFTGKGLSDSDAVMSPTSILEAKHFSAIGNPFFSDKNPSKPPVEVPGPSSENRHHRWENGESRGIGLGIVDALNDEKNEQKSCKPESRMVLFGSQLKIQIPPAFPATSVDSLQSPIEFGIKTKNLLLGSLSPGSKYPLGSSNLGSEASMTRVFTGSLSLSETELSEDYTCVITHGPNPKTTHIFDNYIVESCGNCHSALRKGTCFLPNQLDYPSAGFLSFCHACKKGLGQGKDTYIYRGEKAFCSSECRQQGMLFDEEMGEYSSKLTDDF